MKTPVVVIGSDARADLNEHTLWLRAQAGPETASHLTQAADQTLLKLAAAPGIGSPVTSRRPELQHMRKGQVAGFRDVLIFYLLREDGIYVVRVLHAAKKWHGILDAK